MCLVAANSFGRPPCNTQFVSIELNASHEIPVYLRAATSHSVSELVSRAPKCVPTSCRWSEWRLFRTSLTAICSQCCDQCSPRSCSLPSAPSLPSLPLLVTRSQIAHRVCLCTPVPICDQVPAPGSHCPRPNCPSCLLPTDDRI